MFNSIQGRVTFKNDEKIFIQSGALEWEILCSRTSLRDLPDQEEEVRVYVYLHHREDQLKLYGYATTAERDLFLDLIKVEGIGPRQALRILSGIEVHQFVEALDSDDLDTLVSLPGLGKKTAQKIMLKLKGKLTVSSTYELTFENELLAALTGMGFDRRVARNAVKSSFKELKDKSIPKEALESELLKKAISLINSQESST